MSGTNYLLYIKIAVMYVSFYFQSMSKESLHEATSDQAPVAPPRARRVCHLVVASVAYHLALPYTKIYQIYQDIPKHWNFSRKILPLICPQSMSRESLSGEATGVPRIRVSKALY